MPNKNVDSLTVALREAYTAIVSGNATFGDGLFLRCSYCGEPIRRHSDYCIVRKAEDWLKENKE